MIKTLEWLINLIWPKKPAKKMTYGEWRIKKLLYPGRYK